MHSNPALNTSPASVRSQTAPWHAARGDREAPAAAGIAPTPEDAVAAMIGRRAIWTLRLRQGTVRMYVATTNAARRWNRIDVEIRTDVGDRIWVTSSSLQLLP